MITGIGRKKSNSMTTPIEIVATFSKFFVNPNIYRDEIRNG